MSFRTSLLMSTVAVVLASGTAFAADLPSRTSAPAMPYIPPPPVFTWTGFYVGANAGVAFGNGNNGSVTPYGFTSPAPGTGYTSGSSSSNTSFTGGGQVGYNWQSGALVFGLEADFDYLGNNSNSATVPSSASTPYFVAVHGNNDNYLGTVRGRLGYAVDRALFYVTGGLAYGGNGGGGSVTYYPSSGGPYAYTSSGNNSNVGYVVGGGLEYAFTPNWTARIEYLFVDRGNKSTTYLAPTGAPSGSYFVTNNRNQDNLVRVGLNYKF
jgi:outer membrane immunogenic protein